jgi:hypothetical protein
MKPWMRVGYWIVRNRKSRTKTHIVMGNDVNQRNYCGAAVHRKSAFVRKGAIGTAYPECRNCIFLWRLHHPDKPLA